MKETLNRVAEIKLSYCPAISKKPVIKTSLDAFAELIEFFPPETIGLKEKFCCMYLNMANRVLGVYEVSSGGISSTIVDLRLLLSVAVKGCATSIILCHNHPSGNLKPSNYDLELTKKIKAACRLLDISVADHIIITPERKFFSMSDEGVL